jgi:hypothetical protein
VERVVESFSRRGPSDSGTIVSGLYSFLYLFYSTFGITPPKHGEEAHALMWLLAIVGGSIAFVALMLFAIFKIFV